jgi:hypothetical protein
MLYGGSNGETTLGCGLRLPDRGGAYLYRLSGCDVRVASKKDVSRI